MFHVRQTSRYVRHPRRTIESGGSIRSPLSGTKYDMPPDTRFAQGIVMMSQGLSQIGQALSRYGIPLSPTGTRKRIAAKSKNDSDFGVENLCVVFEGLRQFVMKAMEYNLRQIIGTAPLHEPIRPTENLIKVPQPKGERIFETITTMDPMLGTSSKAKKVPASRIGRALTYGGLLAGLGVGAATEAVRRLASNEERPLLLSEANANRIVETLCQVRGAALKIGQILSLQNLKVVPPEIQQLFVRVRDSAHYMPSWQLNQVMSREWGNKWRSRMDSFEDMPFAAASIGQVHRGVFRGREVAIKVQYPGVAKGINADIDNLMMLLKVWDMLPRGMFINNLVEVARRELVWEVDYNREAASGNKFQELLRHDEVFQVPKVIDELTTNSVLVTELVKGALPVDRLANASQPLRNYISENLLRLTLNEIFIYRYMQTDPNWSNFLYQPSTQRVVLLDFGATRSYKKSFIDTYLKVIEAAAERDEVKILNLSEQIGFLTGEESEIMRRAHCDAVLILGEAFTVDEFDFGEGRTEEKVGQLIPIMLKHRLTPPPEEIYSLHRKLSGIFLLCSKLRAKIDCRSMFMDIREQYHKEQQNVLLK
ncbi:atypical kinase COQ8B, mitochondrial-like [Varroa destructor]|uniref:ABC1 atypical kinase-like domain-containing protein n=1 Tax=Varroa destructor TaxID=109461 RepID=A0A7M7JP88_VARDE|nr:atypical kinase COQ8B, mitochondrial-like [Varroa destructor]